MEGLGLQGSTERTLSSSTGRKARKGGVRHLVEVLCGGDRIISEVHNYVHYAKLC